MQLTNVYNFISNEYLTQKDIDHMIYNPYGYWYNMERELDGLPFSVSND